MTAESIPYRRKVRGATSLELMVVVVIILAAVTVAVPVFLNKSTVNRENLTRKKIKDIKQAIVGYSTATVADSRTDFGFVGDLGILPDNTTNPTFPLIDLMENQGNKYPAYQLQSNVGFGWRGPYLQDKMENSNYVALYDAWNRLFRYQDLDGVSSSRDAEIRSAGPDGVFDNGDDIYDTIVEDEVRTYVSGTFRDRTQQPIHDSQVTVFFPGGIGGLDSVQITTTALNDTQYDSQTDTVSDPNKRKIPIGSRYFETFDHQLKKLAALNSGDMSIVNFVDGGAVTPPAPFFERTFYSTDDTAPDTGSPVTVLTGTWNTDGNGNYFADGGVTEHLAVYGLTSWQDYRLEVDATLNQGEGYGIYYRVDGQLNITGYEFRYEPGLNQPGFDMTFVVRKVVNGVVLDPPLQRLDLTSAQFPNVFNASHRISITLQGNRHIIKVDGSGLFDFTDNSYLTGQAGLHSWEGQHFADFHHLLAYEIPPLSTGEIVWWSFEEGGGSTVYGSGFEIGASEINGTLMNTSNVYRRWDNGNIHGQAIYATGSNNGYIDFGDVNVLDFLPTDAFSISAWVKMDSINTAADYVVISKVSQVDQIGWKLMLIKESSYNFGAQFSFQQTQNSQQLVQLNNLEIQEGNWYHIIVTYDGTGYSGSQTIDPSALNVYVTPHTANTAPISPTLINLEQDLLASSNTGHNGNFLIGAEINGSTRFEGYIDEVRIYNKALSASEINEVFQKEK
ncbi:MAG: LamG domain-containing protein [bacterium]|nr:LamG domain-containing protein [bacterium]